MRARGIEELNAQVRRADTLLPLPPPAPLERRASGCWMGYERKRGKLADLNCAAARRRARRALRARSSATSTALRDVRYVITLDTDTQLPRDAARQLVGTMAHPLNRPRFDPARQRRVRGLRHPAAARGRRACRAASRSRYARLYGGEPGIDPYTRAVSDVYQDLFGEGSFIGKGIYDVDAFERALDGRFPENRILSHDLLEGCYARSGLLSDVELFEEYPARYAADVARRHRWIRGDWQIAAGCCRGCRAPTAALQRNPLSALSRWKIFDNLRRSLVPVALLLLLLARLAGCCRRRGSGPLVVVGIVVRAGIARPHAAAVPQAAGHACCGSTSQQPLRSAVRAAAPRRCLRSPACRTRRSSA